MRRAVKGPGREERAVVQKAFYLMVMAWLFVAGPVAVAVGEPAAFKQASALVREGQYTAAVEVYSRIAATADGANSRARASLFWAAVSHRHLNRSGAALARLAEIGRRYPDTPTAADALFNIGSIHYESGRYGKAHAAFTAFTRKYPENLRVRSAASWADSARRRQGPMAAGENGGSGPGRWPSVIRVLLAQNVARCVLDSDGPLKLWNPADGSVLHRGAGPLVMTSRQGRKYVNGVQIAASAGVAVMPLRVDAGGAKILLDGRPYRGEMTLLDAPKGYDVVNRLGVEAYLYGVVPEEMPSAWPRQALMAQAVAARTYAFNVMEKTGAQPFDVDGSTTFQVYGGAGRETVATGRAVDDTRGQVMTSGGKPIIAYYHSDSGGHTEDPVHVWGVQAPYLQGMPDRFSGEVAWKFFLPWAKAGRLLASVGGGKRLTGFSPRGISPSGRAMRVLLTFGEQEKYLSANDFRLLVGATRLKSTLFTAEPSGGGIRFKGKGYGHGVGMSQHGAFAMAREGGSFREILRHYYPGVEISRVPRT